MNQVSQTTKNLLFLLLILIVVFFVGRCTASQSIQDKGGVLTKDVKVKTDTIRVPQFIHDTVLINKPTLQVVYKETQFNKIPLIQSNGESTLLHRVYKNEKEVIKGVKLGYTAKVSGVLDSINLSFTDTRDKLIVRDSVFITNTLTKTKYSTGLYVGGFSNQQLTNLGPEIQLVRPKFNVGVGYDLRNQSPQFRVGINLLKHKE